MLEVIKAGLQTSIQDWPGRVGHLSAGFPWSGPMDSWSFRLANLLVGNPLGEAGLECQFVGPTLRFHRDALIAVTGADMRATLDGAVLPMWESIAVRGGQTLTMASVALGARSYLAVAGGLRNDVFLGSRSTFHKAGIGGIDGHALRAGDVIPYGEGWQGRAGRCVRETARPSIENQRHHEIEICRGPNDDWIDEASHRRFFAADWKLTAKSDRSGFRLEGPEWTFTERALVKTPENGSEPSNIIDQGYPLGALNLCGQTPIILVHDSPSGGGFINPYTVPTCAYWKLAQSRPGDLYRFIEISVSAAQDKAREISRLCSEASIV